MTIHDPTTQVGDKVKKPQASYKNAKQASNFTIRDYVDVESNFHPNLSDDADIKYLERMKLRSRL